MGRRRTRKLWWHTPFGNSPIVVAIWWGIWTPIFYGGIVWATIVLSWFLAQLTGWGIVQILTTPPNTSEGTT